MPSSSVVSRTTEGLREQSYLLPVLISLVEMALVWQCEVVLNHSTKSGPSLHVFNRGWASHAWNREMKDRYPGHFDILFR